MDFPLQIGVAVHHLAKLIMFDFYYNKYINREDFELLQMDTHSNHFAFSEDRIDKLINPDMIDEYNRDIKKFQEKKQNCTQYLKPMPKHLH